MGVAIHHWKYGRRSGCSVENLRFISVDSLYSNLGKNFCKALPTYHAFTGSDFAVSFSQKGKIQPLKKLKKDLHAQIAFTHLGELEDGQSNDFIEIEKFTCKIYGKKNLRKIVDVITEIFMEKYKPKIDGDKVSCAKKLGVATMWTYLAKRNKTSKVCCENVEVIHRSFAS